MMRLNPDTFSLTKTSMTQPQHYRLDVWKRSMRLVRSVYEITAGFPDTERFVLVSQMRRSATSVPSNIAEGAARSSESEFRRFLLMSRGSLMELDTQLWIARDLGYLEDGSDVHAELLEILAMLNGLIRERSERIRKRDQGA